MISRKELEDLEIGKTIWYSEIKFGPVGGLSYNVFAKLEKINIKYFKVIFVEQGDSFRTGNLIFTTQLYPPSVFNTREEGLDHWNSIVYNTIDKLTHEYENRIRRVKKKLIT